MFKGGCWGAPSSARAVCPAALDQNLITRPQLCCPCSWDHLSPQPSALHAQSLKSSLEVATRPLSQGDTSCIRERIPHAHSFTDGVQAFRTITGFNSRATTIPSASTPPSSSRRMPRVSTSTTRNGCRASRSTPPSTAPRSKRCSRAGRTSRASIRRTQAATPSSSRPTNTSREASSPSLRLL